MESTSSNLFSFYHKYGFVPANYTKISCVYGYNEVDFKISIQ